MPTFDLMIPRSQAMRNAPREPINPFAAAWVLISRWIGRCRERDALGELDDRLLRDIGITRADAERECRKPFWR